MCQTGGGGSRSRRNVVSSNTVGLLPVGAAEWCGCDELASLE